MTDPKEYLVGEAAEILKVSTRTLRHWDEIGLLVPQWRTWSDHRLYTQDDLQRGMDIVLYRAAGVPLKDIAVLLDAEAESAEEILRKQRRLLEGRIGQLHGMIRAVDDLLAAEARAQNSKEEPAMSMEDKVELFGANWPGVEEEAHQRWGETPEWSESRRREAAMGSQDWKEVKAKMDAFSRDLAQARTHGVRPGSAEARKLVDAHANSISGWYEVTRARQVILARMYVEDSRFETAYQGNQDYLLQLVEAQAVKEGLELESLAWD